MTTIKVKFSIRTDKVNSEVSEIQEIQLDGDETAIEIESTIEEVFEEWILKKTHYDWKVIE